MIKCNTILALMFLFLNACGGGGSVSVLPSSDEYDQYSQLNPKMDILWVVDNSNSMKEEINNVITNIENFVSVYIDQDYDFRMGVVSSSAWALESYKEYADWKVCLDTAVVPEDCDSLAPQDDEDRSYLMHPADGKSVFGRFHTGECINENSGHAFIHNDTADITNVFSMNFNVYGVDDGGSGAEGNCGTNRNFTPSNSSSPYHIPFVHNYYYGSTINYNGSGAVTNWRSTERGRLFAYVGDERPIQSMRAFLNPEISPELSGFLRPDAFLAVILITDEEDHSRTSLKAVNGTAGSEPIQNYVDFLTDLKGSSDLYKVYSITQLSGRARLKAMAEDTGGFVVEIKRSDDGDPDPSNPGKTKGEVRYLDMLTQITSNIVESATIFSLKCAPNLASGISIEFFEPPYTSGLTVPKASDNGGEGWNYTTTGGSDPGVITFTEDFYPQSGTKIYINYTPLNLGCDPKAD